MGFCGYEDIRIYEFSYEIITDPSCLKLIWVHLGKSLLYRVRNFLKASRNKVGNMKTRYIKGFNHRFDPEF